MIAETITESFVLLFFKICTLTRAIFVFAAAPGRETKVSTVGLAV